MTKLTKKKKQLLELVNPENTYSLDEAMTIFQQLNLQNLMNQLILH
jgi:hypothetical protein